MSTPSPASESSHHLLVPFAIASAAECRALVPQLKLPQLDRLLAALKPAHTDPGDDHTLSLPHERALARALGLGSQDGRIPWAAAHSDRPTEPQAWFHPCHFQIGMGEVSLLPGDQLDLNDLESRALFDALAPFCAEDGIRLHYESPTRWIAQGAPLRDIVCASLDRVSGRAVDGWLPNSPDNPQGGQLLKRLQSEAQMLFYTHPVHDARSARGLLPVNGFWVSGAGALDAATPLRMAPVVPDTLRQAALRTDWTAWQQAWTALDEGAIADQLQALQRGEPVALTLCGERRAQTWVNAPRGAGQRVGRLFKQWLGHPPAWKSLDPL